MKTISINPFIWIKSILINSMVNKRTHLVKYVNAGKFGSNNPSKNKEVSVVGNALKPDKNEFQRKAHLGNFFAGPHCVFDPKLFY